MARPVGNTVSAVLLAGLDLKEIDVGDLEKLDMGKAEASSDLISGVSIETTKSEAERWHRDANVILGPSAMKDFETEIAKRPETSDEGIKVASGTYEGKTVHECRIVLQKETARHLQLRSGGNFWAWVYFQQMTEPDNMLPSVHSRCPTRGIREFIAEGRCPDMEAQSKQRSEEVTAKLSFKQHSAWYQRIPTGTTNPCKNAQWISPGKCQGVGKPSTVL